MARTRRGKLAGWGNGNHDAPLPLPPLRGRIHRSEEGVLPLVRT